MLFTVIACNGPMQDGVKVFLLMPDGSLVPKWQTLNTGSRTLAKKELQKAQAVVFCKKGYYCIAKWTDEMDYLNYDEQPIEIPEIVREDAITEKPSELITFHIIDCDTQSKSDPQFETVIMMDRSGTLRQITPVSLPSPTDPMIRKSDLSEGKYLFFCGKPHRDLNSCTMLSIDEPNFFQKDDRTVSMSRFFLF